MTGLKWENADLPNSDPAQVRKEFIPPQLSDSELARWKKSLARRATSQLKKARRKQRKAIAPKAAFAVPEAERRFAKTNPQSGRRRKSPLVIPETQARLIWSIFADMGHCLPKRIAPLNKAIAELIKQGVLLRGGQLNRKHPLFSDWLDMLESRRREPLV